MHDIKWRIHGRRGIPDTEPSMVITRLEELPTWQPVDHEQWCSSDSW
ncbi:hypothetical protein [Streptomyces sp. NPDC001787]